MKWLENYRAEIDTLCKTYKVKSLYTFGSVLTEKFNDESDIDLIVDFLDMEVEDYADNYFDFKFALQDVFGRQIDLLEERGIKNHRFKESVSLRKRLLFET
ncbi:nucleotidyltransferase family protein [Dyadobacter sp. CY351]|uniref:nucleotidyltransferase family protein n=1 Tax=Dyadobacter sp. CY351 TaxID=2909337 RepID=UPI001F3C15AD|nr:nucleotidyltransferase domain-containing protein [Dyadobacter sp. CY351]MCF2516327.1 nucleotidyltransferase domain-containing protein [Dyadobacter sp. CY351]